MTKEDLSHLVSATPEQLLAEFHNIVAQRAPLLRAQTRGALLGLDLKAKAFGGAIDIGIEWTLRAQIGTLDKLEALLAEQRAYAAFELIAVARNLFENLIWLRLFGLDRLWGVRFYGQFLKQHEEDLTRTIAKMEAEAELFRRADIEEDSDMDAAFANIDEGDQPLDEQVDAVMESRKKQGLALDAKIRRSFSLFAASARFNGYGYQAHLITTEHVPRHQAQLGLIRQRMATFEASLPDPQAIRDAYRWLNWKECATRVGMLDQYEFLYAFTSRLLHASPLNIVTEKSLLPSETTMLLEYVVVTATDMMDAIEAYTFPGRLNMVAVESGRD